MARRRVYRVDATRDLLDEIGDDQDDAETAVDSQIPDDAAPVERLVHRLLSDAAALRASDLHLESDADGPRVRLRVDGQTIDLRVSTMPTLDGEILVRRLLPKAATGSGSTSSG